jgi:hypothetical protein
MELAIVQLDSAIDGFSLAVQSFQVSKELSLPGPDDGLTP